MCGIIGYIGSRNATPLLLEGLKKLEYRGYDSAGVCVQSDGQLRMVKKKGPIAVLEMALSQMALRGTIGIAHVNNAWNRRHKSKKLPNPSCITAIFSI